MLFNSYAFVFAFLPMSLLGFYWLGRHGGLRAALGWLVGCSLFFYGWWNPAYLALLTGSIAANFFLGNAIARRQERPAGKALLCTGIAANLGLIGYYKYAGFLVANLNMAAGTGFDAGHILLPLAISFFTFQQITYLVDSYAGKVRETDWLRYALFVTFFPQLIAGPIVHHAEMMPQFARRALACPRTVNLSVGLTIFAIGLFKKAVLADGIAPYADSVFAAADQGEPLDAIRAWSGALAYTFQLYFDFSGYTDMAIGVARMFGIILPLNFNSPYKARDIVDFWRRWHMTLSRFLRDYVYIPLGGNRRGGVRRYANLLTTMLLGGLWHGAGWNFVIWGGLHGGYLVVNHGWSMIRRRYGLPGLGPLALPLTFFAVVVAWVFFRAPTLDGAMVMLAAMAGDNGAALPAAVAYRAGEWAPMLAAAGLRFEAGGGAAFLSTWAWIVVLAAAAFLLPNTQEMMRRYRPALDMGLWSLRRWQWRPTPAWSAYAACLLAIGVLSLPEVSAFLYFQF
jgi:D-alanyl-lipoteichoic acid acyltransferase DltB (MBOAT superfamily)